MEKVLFISHNAGRSGAPLVLLNLLKWLKENTSLSFEILLRGPGELQAEFADLAPTFLFSCQKSSENALSRICRKIGLSDNLSATHHQNLLNHFRESGIKLIFSSTFTNGDILQTLAPLGCRVITHVHELNYWIDLSGTTNIQQVLKHTSRYIAGSKVVRDNLITARSIPPDNIDLAHEFIPIPDISADPTGIRDKFAISGGSCVVLGSGHETWRKGKDLFVQLAAQVQKIMPEPLPHFLWVGGFENDEIRRQIFHDVEKLGLTGRVHFTGAVPGTLNYFAVGDLFAMVSREDSFPLVCLEAALLGKPTICFADVGGMTEFVDDDAGVVVPYLDLEAMAGHIVSLLKNETTRTRLGNNAREKVLTIYNVASGSERIAEIINRELRKNDLLTA